MGPSRKIAVIEDDPQIRTLVETLLVAGGYEVASTGAPLTAQGLVRSFRPDLVLCDIAMPDLDGYGVLKGLQDDPATAKVPVVFLTAHQEFSERVRAFRYGVVDYLAKPFTGAVLLKRIERVFDSLGERTGVTSASGEEASTLLEDLQREARTGVLTIEGAEGAARLVLRAGDVVHASGEAPKGPATARFNEMDPGREDILAHDPPALPTSAAALPSFADIPEVLRQVLVVDDNRVFRTFVRELLGGQGFTVYEATNGQDALRIALEKRPWLILTDIRMPGEDGFELCRKVRSHSLIRQTPLLFLSGWDDYKARYQGLELGADDFISKETPVRELLIRIQLILKRYMAMGRGSKGAAMEGQLDVMGAPGVLQVCHLTRLMGTLEAESGVRQIRIQFREGEIVSARGEGREGIAAVYEILSWESGRFVFTPGPVEAGPGLGEGFSQLLLEGCRQLDELRRTAAPAGD